MRLADPEASEDPPRRYVLVESDRYAAERDQAVLSRNRTLGPGYAQRWYMRLSQRSFDLPGFPGPLSHAKDEAASTVFGREVRRFLYYGPTNKRTGTPVRILFTVLPPAPDEPPETAETVILLLRLLHGAQALPPEDLAEGE